MMNIKGGRGRKRYGWIWRRRKGRIVEVEVEYESVRREEIRKNSPYIYLWTNGQIVILHSNQRVGRYIVHYSESIFHYKTISEITATLSPQPPTVA
jgi:hypothetical protein